MLIVFHGKNCYANAPQYNVYAYFVLLILCHTQHHITCRCVFTTVF